MAGRQYESGEINIEALIYLDVPREELIRRLLERGRHDDNESAIQKRFEEYSNSTSPIIDDYKKRGIRVIELDGSGAIEDIQAEMLTALDKESD